MADTKPITATRRRLWPVAAFGVGAALSLWGAVTAVADSAALAVAHGFKGWSTSAKVDRVLGQKMIDAGIADEDAVNRLSNGLRGRPGAADDWLRLVDAERLLHGCGPRAAQALRLSIDVNPFDIHTTSYRVSVGMALWPCMGSEDRAAFDRLLRVQWAWGPGRLAEIAARTGGDNVVRRALAASPEALAAFNHRCVTIDPQCAPPSSGEPFH